jgi:hypothetical protein
VEHPPLQGLGILHPDHHEVSRFSKYARRGEEIGRPDLVQVLVTSWRAFGAVHAEPGPVGLADGEDEIAHPGHRQIGQHLVVGPQVVELAEAFDVSMMLRFDSTTPLGLPVVPEV